MHHILFMIDLINSATGTKKKKNTTFTFSHFQSNPNALSVYILAVYIHFRYLTLKSFRFIQFKYFKLNYIFLICLINSLTGQHASLALLHSPLPTALHSEQCTPAHKHMLILTKSLAISP